MFQPVYDTASNIGLLYDFGKALMSTILAGLGIFVGIQIKNYYSEYTEKKNAKIVTVDCYYTDNKKKIRNAMQQSNMRLQEQNIKMTMYLLERLI